MKKSIIMILLMLLPMVVFGDVFGDTGSSLKETGKLVGGLLFIGVVAIWMLPLVFGAMVYSGQKKKAEQQHEEVGMKAALYALIAIIIGSAASFYVVGSIGKLAYNDAGTGTLTQGNSYFLETLFGKGQAAIKN